MLKLEAITKNAVLIGIEPGEVVRVVPTEPVGDNALTAFTALAQQQVSLEMDINDFQMSIYCSM